MRMPLQIQQSFYVQTATGSEAPVLLLISRASCQEVHALKQFSSNLNLRSVEAVVVAVTQVAQESEQIMATSQLGGMCGLLCGQLCISMIGPTGNFSSVSSVLQVSST